MSITAPAGPKRELPPAGNHLARVYQIIHIGTVTSDFKNEDGSEKTINKVRIGWELPNEMRVFKEGADEQPMSMSQEYTLSMNEKANLRKLIEGILGVALEEKEAESFDVVKLIGMSCMIQVNHKTSAAGNQYAVVVNAATVPKGMKVPKAINDPKILDYDNWDQTYYDTLPDFLKETISSSYQYRSKFKEK